MNAYAPVTDALQARLEAIVGPSEVLVSQAAVEPYAHDETEDRRHPPDLVVRPGSTEEVAAVLRAAFEAGVPTTPRGGGTGLSGGALAVHGGIVLSIERMDGILEIDEANLMCVVQPGVITQVLQDTVAEQGLYYPPDPASRGSCRIGGNIAENAGGPHCVKYGVTRDYVLGLEAVTVGGDVFRTGGKLRKDVAGYDLTQLLVGSEGTLAVVTEATLRLVPLPPYRRLLLLPFASLEAAGEGIVSLYRARMLPSVMEIVGRSALELAEAHLGRPVPFRDAQAQILLEFDGTNEDALDAEAAKAAEVLMAAGALDAVLADTPAKERAIWEVRRCLGEAVKKSARHVECDTSVPPADVPALFGGVREIAARHGVREISYGHAGDGNVHVNLLGTHDDPEEDRRALEGAAEAVFRFATALGGTITGEHGVGCVQSRFLPLCRDAVALASMRAVKHALDPRGLLNPGKIFV